MDFIKSFLVLSGYNLEFVTSFSEVTVSILVGAEVAIFNNILVHLIQYPANIFQVKISVKTKLASVLAIFSLSILYKNSFLYYIYGDIIYDDEVAIIIYMY